MGDIPLGAWPVGAWLALGGLLLPAASPPLAAQEPVEPAGAQAGQPADAQALIDRIRQIQGELAPGAPAAEQPPPQETGPQETEPQGSARPAMSEEQVRTLLRDSLGVEVLRVEVVEHGGQPAYAATVMMPPGNRNNALMVATLLVDGATGALLGHESSAPRTPAPHLPTIDGRYVPESGGLDIRRRTWR